MGSEEVPFYGLAIKDKVIFNVISTNGETTTVTTQGEFLRMSFDRFAKIFVLADEASITYVHKQTEINLAAEKQETDHLLMGVSRSKDRYALLWGDQDGRYPSFVSVLGYE